MTETTTPPEVPPTPNTDTETPQAEQHARPAAEPAAQRPQPQTKPGNGHGPSSGDGPPITLREMLSAGMHFGHQTKRWNPKMRPYIFGARNGIHIIDLQQTLPLFINAYNKVVETVANGHYVLFVGTKKQAQTVIQEEAERCGMFYVTHRWLGGTLTNWRTVKSSIEQLRSIEQKIVENEDNLTKKEILFLNRRRAKLERNLGGIKNMTALPGVVVMVDPRKEHIAIAEANKLEIPLIALTDSNCDPDVIDFVVPGNDDAIRAIRLFTNRLAEACILGQRLGRERAVVAARAHEARGDEPPEPIRVHSGGDGPKVEVVSRRSAPRPEPEAAATPEENNS